VIYILFLYSNYKPVKLTPKVVKLKLEIVKMVSARNKNYETKACLISCHMIKISTFLSLWQKSACVLKPPYLKLASFESVTSV